MPAFLLLSLLACLLGRGDADTAPPPTPRGRGDSGTEGEASCGPESPTITAFTAGPGGIHHFERGDFPCVQLDARAEDPDGDLVTLYLELWWNPHVDGFVDTSVEPDRTRWVTLSTGDCDTPTAELTSRLSSGSQVEACSWYDFAVRVTDQAGHASEPAYATGGVTCEDGSDPPPLDEEDTGR